MLFKMNCRQSTQTIARSWIFQCVTELLYSLRHSNDTRAVKKPLFIWMSRCYSTSSVIKGLFRFENTFSAVLRCVDFCARQHCVQLLEFFCAAFQGDVLRIIKELSEVDFWLLLRRGAYPPKRSSNTQILSD